MKHIKLNIIFSGILILFFSFNIFAQQATVTVNANPKIDQLLTLKKSLEKDNEFTDGYTIQLYYGEMNKASDVLKRYRNSYSSWPASIKYETPNYKVWAGNFATRLEADRALMEIQNTFTSAFILKPTKK